MRPSAYTGSPLEGCRIAFGVGRPSNFAASRNLDVYYWDNQTIFDFDIIL